MRSHQPSANGFVVNTLLIQAGSLVRTANGNGMAAPNNSVAERGNNNQRVAERGISTCWRSCLQMVGFQFADVLSRMPSSQFVYHDTGCQGCSFYAAKLLRCALDQGFLGAFLLHLHEKKSFFLFCHRAEIIFMVVPLALAGLCFHWVVGICLDLGWYGDGSICPLGDICVRGSCHGPLGDICVRGSRWWLGGDICVERHGTCLQQHGTFFSQRNRLSSPTSCV